MKKTFQKLIVIWGFFWFYEIVSSLSISNDSEQNYVNKVRMSRSMDNPDVNQIKRQFERIGLEINEMSQNFFTIFDTLIKECGVKIVELETKMNDKMDRKLLESEEKLSSEIKTHADRLENFETDMAKCDSKIGEIEKDINNKMNKKLLEIQTRLSSEIITHTDRLDNLQTDMAKYDTNTAELEIKINNKMTEKLMEIQTSLSSEIKTLENTMKKVESEIAKNSDESESFQNLQLSETERIKRDIDELLEKINEMELRNTETHLSIPIDIQKAANGTLNSIIHQVKEELESKFNQLSEEIHEINTTATAAYLFVPASVIKSKNETLNEIIDKIKDKIESNRTLFFDQFLSTLEIMPEKSCKDIKMKNYSSKTGEYFIQPDINDKSNKTIKIYCDMESDGGGWSVIQRRGVRNIPKAEREIFSRGWVEYENGFGSTDDDHWIGLKNIYFLTNQNSCGNELLIKLRKWNGVEKWARFTEFSISGSEDFYRLNISGGYGNATNIGSLMFNNKNMRFTTADRDNDKNIYMNCAAYHGGGWWHNSCTRVNLNGEYSEDGQKGKRRDEKGIFWESTDAPLSYSYMKTQMKIKSKC